VLVLFFADVVFTAEVCDARDDEQRCAADLLKKNCNSTMRKTTFWDVPSDRASFSMFGAFASHL
jgi:hypothetical protein